MKIEVHNRVDDFTSYRAARVKSLFNAENGCNWEHVAELTIEGIESKIGLAVTVFGNAQKSNFGFIKSKEVFSDILSRIII